MSVNQLSSVWATSKRFSQKWLKATAKVQHATLTASYRNLNLLASTSARMWGLSADEIEQVMPADKRFKNDTWTENIAFDWLKQNYLITAKWLLDMADAWEPIDEKLHAQAVFWTQQWVDAASPTNFAMTNPEVLEEIYRTGGNNLIRGLQNWIADVENGRIKMVPEDSFTVGKDLAITPGKVVYRNKLIELIQYEPSTDQVFAKPILVVPPWINKYYIMDLQQKNSMYKYLVDQGFTLFSISWKNPDDSVYDLEWADYIELGPLAALQVVQDITGVERPNMVGYCLGGVILQTTLAYMVAQGQEIANSATFFTTHQDFRDAGDIGVFLSKPGVAMVEWIMKMSGGYLDGRNMAATFNMLRANDLLWNYVVNNYLLGKEPASFDLLYWNSDGTRVPGKTHSFLLKEFFLENKLMEPNAIKIRDVGLDTSKIMSPTYCVAGSTDHIVPWKGASRMREQQSGPVRFILAESGHIAGIINHPASNKRGYWVNENVNANSLTAEAWLEGATHHKGSWWPDWVSWLAELSGDMVSPPSMGNEQHPPLIDAPGAYVLKK